MTSIWLCPYCLEVTGMMGHKECYDNPDAKEASAEDFQEALEQAYLDEGYSWEEMQEELYGD